MKNQQYPSKYNQIKNIVSTAKDIVVGAFENKTIFVNEEVKKTRTNICKQCEFYVVEDDRCKICGCNITNKVQFSETFCPIMKWDKDNTSSPGKT